jgi:hypothetical protein
MADWSSICYLATLRDFGSHKRADTELHVYWTRPSGRTLEPPGHSLSVVELGHVSFILVLFEVLLAAVAFSRRLPVPLLLPATALSFLDSA